MMAKRLFLTMALTCRFLTPGLARAKELSPDQARVAGKLIAYCRACHAVGPLRFIHDDESDAANAAKVWTTIQEQYVPGSKTLWKDAILGALSWPTPMPPRAGSERLPGMEWMPKGINRAEIANDIDNDEDARQFIVRILRQTP